MNGDDYWSRWIDPATHLTQKGIERAIEEMQRRDNEPKYKHICIDLTGDPNIDGQFFAVPLNHTPILARERNGVRVPIVWCGGIRWWNGTPIEIWVPQDQLEHWRAEFDVDGYR